MDDYPFIREVKSPVDDFQLRPLDPRCQVVQFSAPLTDHDFSKLASFLIGYPNVPLRIYGHYQGASDFGFLKYFPFLKGFQGDVFEIQSWDGLECLSGSLEFLALGATRRRFSLSLISRFTGLTDLFLDGHKKDISVLGGFTELVYLTLQSVSLPDLSLLEPLSNLRSLALKLGGTNQLALLPSLTQLRYLELWMIRALSDLSAIGRLGELRYLFLQDLKNVTSLPSFSGLHKLHRVHIENLKGLSDLRPIAEAPCLEELVLAQMSHVKLEDLRCFCSHPTLSKASIGLGSQRRNIAAATLLGLPSVTDIKPICRYVEAR